MDAERDRLAFLEARDGPEATRAWALRTMRIYRTCVLQTGRGGRKFHHGSQQDYRRGFVESYVCLKHYAATRCMGFCKTDAGACSLGRACDERTGR